MATSLEESHKRGFLCNPTFAFLILCSLCFTSFSPAYRLLSKHQDLLGLPHTLKDKASLYIAGFEHHLGRDPAFLIHLCPSQA